MRASEGIRTPE